MARRAFAHAPRPQDSQASYVDGVLHVKLGRELRNANSGSRNPHWTVKHRSRETWRDAIRTALLDRLGAAQALALFAPTVMMGAKGGLVCRCPYRPCHCPPSLRRRLSMIRWCPSARHLIADEFDNLRTSTKEIRDAITSLGLIRDDRGKWCQMEIEQRVSPDGLWWVEFTIAPIDLASETR